MLGANGYYLVQQGSKRMNRFRHRRLRRLGTASMEGVMLAAVMIPLSAALLLLMIRICKLLHEVVASHMSWPFL
jgi:hypothetical protein